MKPFEASNSDDFLGFLKEMTTEALIKKEEFLSFDFHKYREEKGFGVYLKKLTFFYQNLALFPDKDIKNHFLKSGVTEDSLKWFITIEDILDELEKIMITNKVSLTPIPLMIFLKSHLDIKIVHQIILDFNLRNDKGKNMVHSLLTNSFRRRNYGKGTPRTFKSPHDLTLNEKIDSFEKILPDIKKLKKELLELSLGKTRDLFLSQIYNCFKPEGLKESEFSNLVYDFFKLIMKDDLLMYSFDDYLDKAKRSYRSYKIYRAKRIKDLFIEKMNPNHTKLA